MFWPNPHRRKRRRRDGIYPAQETVGARPGPRPEGARHAARSGRPDRSDDYIAFANLEAEYFFSSSQSQLAKSKIQDFVPFSSPLLALIEQVREHESPVNEYRVDLSSPRLGADRIVDVHVTPVADEPGAMVIVFRERSMADKFDRQMTHRGAARSVTGLASMLGHEIKNPLSGIRGAAQLLEAAVSDEDRALTGLIRDETDRIVSLVDRMEVFSDERPIEREPVNIHVVLDRVHQIAASGFCARHRVRRSNTIPSLPMVLGNKDQLIQVFLNLVKNASEACEHRDNAQIRLKTAFRPGVRLSIPEPTSASPCRSSSASRTTARAFPKTSRCTCSIRSSRPSRTVPASGLRWSPRSSATMAA
jgi:two-component system nitrogen regulation sensor histidine kinase GlnL